MEATQIIEQAKKFIEQEIENGHIDINKIRDALVLDFMRLAKFDPDLAETLLDDPDEIKKGFQEAWENNHKGKVQARFINTSDSINVLVSELDEKDIDKYIAVEGVVRSVSDREPLVTIITFECPSCGNILPVLQNSRLSDPIKQPNKCGCGRKGKFKKIDDKKVNHFTITIEEPTDLSQSQKLSTMQVIFKRDLSNPIIHTQLYTGVRILIRGTLRAKHYMKGNRTLNKMYYYLEANSVDVLGEESITVDLSDEDRKQIKQFAKENKYPEEKIAKGIFRGIYGHDNKKLLLTTMLVGGVKKELDSGYVRGDIHIVMCGDSGQAKTVIGKKLISKSPRRSYVAGGESASRTGITFTIDKDPHTDKRYIVAGAIPRAHKGICFIDEFDGLKNADSKSINEALEDQEVTVNMSVSGKLKSETAVLFGANPKEGNFVPDQPKSVQIDFPSAVLSRSDIILVFEGKVDGKKDMQIAKTMLGLQEEQPDYLDDEFIMKYIQYAKNLEPIVTTKAKEYIAKRYSEIRKEFSEQDSNTVPIEPRSLRTFQRVTEAMAKLRLKDVATIVEAELAVEKVWEAHHKVVLDPESGVLDALSIPLGKSSSQRQLMEEIRAILIEKKEDDQNAVEIEQIKQILDSRAKEEIKSGRFDDIIEKMKMTGEIFEPRRGLVGLCR